MLLASTDAAIEVAVGVIPVTAPSGTSLPSAKATQSSVTAGAVASKLAPPMTTVEVCPAFNEPGAAEVMSGGSTTVTVTAPARKPTVPDGLTMIKIGRA